MPKSRLTLPPPRVRADQLPAWSFDAFESARYQVTSLASEIERLSGPRLADVGADPAVGEELEPTDDAVAQGEVSVQELPRAPVAHGDAEPVAEMVFGVVRDVDAMATA